MTGTVLFERLFLGAFAVAARLRTVFADTGCDAEANRASCRRFGVEPHIPKRWPVKRTNAWLLDNKRPALRYDRFGCIVQALLQAAYIFVVAPRLAQELWKPPLRVRWESALESRFVPV